MEEALSGWRGEPPLCSDGAGLRVTEPPGWSRWLKLFMSGFIIDQGCPGGPEVSGDGDRRGW